MPKLVEITNNIYRKQPTQADFLRPTGVLADAIVVITAEHVSSRVVETGFRFDTGENQLEVYLNGQYIRTYEWIEGQQYGEYEEWTNFSVRFTPNYIQVGDIVRFRVTSANYSSIYSGGGTGGAAKDIQDLIWNLNQLGKEVFGDEYVFNYTGNPGTRTIGIMPENVLTPDLSHYRTWKTPLYAFTPSTPREISNFTNCRADDVKYIIFQDSNTALLNNANIKLQGGDDFLGNAGDFISLIFDGSVWYEMTRSLNS